METFVSALIFVIVFGSILFLAFVTTKYIGTKTGNSMKSRHINILETVQLGLDSKLHLVKIGDEFILISSSGKNIQMLKTLKLEHYSSEESPNANASLFDFKDIFEKYLPRLKDLHKKKIDDRTENNENCNSYDSKVFKKNLDKLRNFTAVAGGLKSDDGDENTNENQT